MVPTTTRLAPALPRAGAGGRRQVDAVPDDVRRWIAGLLAEPVGGADLLEWQAVAEPGERRADQSTGGTGVGVEAVAQRLVPANVVGQHDTVAAQPLRGEGDVGGREVVGEADVRSGRGGQGEAGQMEQLAGGHRQPARAAREDAESDAGLERGRWRRGEVGDEDAHGVPARGHRVRDGDQRLDAAREVEAGQGDREANLSAPWTEVNVYHCAVATRLSSGSSASRRDAAMVDVGLATAGRRCGRS